MKLLFVNALYAPHRVGGAELSTQSLAEGMRDAGHVPVVATCGIQPGVRVAEVNGVKVYYIGLKNVYWPYAGKRPGALMRAIWHAVDRYNPWMQRAAEEVIERERPDVVNTQVLTGFSSSIGRAVRRRRLPLFHTLRDYSLMCPNATMFKSCRNCTRQCWLCRTYVGPNRAFSAHVDGVIGISRYILDRHVAAGYFENVRLRRVIYNALPTRPAAVPSRRAPGDPLRLGYVGRLSRSKGIEQLIDVMGTWHESVCRLVVAGTGPADYERGLRERAPSNVDFLGFVEPAQIYGRIDVLVVPSLWDEPFGRIVIEAYMHGVPVIATDRGGLPELVEDGKTGIIYPSHSAARLRDAINVFLGQPNLIDELRRCIAAKAGYFRVERMIAEYSEVLCRAA